MRLKISKNSERCENIGYKPNSNLLGHTMAKRVTGSSTGNVKMTSEQA